MAVQDVVEPDGNYKGLLIQYCQERGLSQPRFTETQHGTPDAPSWKVIVHYGDRVHETDDPIPGAKKGAHQFAAKQVLDSINENRQRLLSGDVSTNDDNSQDVTAQEDITQEDIAQGNIAQGNIAQGNIAQGNIAQGNIERRALIEQIDAPLELVTSALTVANERLSSAQPGRYRTISDAEYSRKVAQLTMQIVRDLVKAADEANVTFP